jgi:hypothetical protein
MVTNEINEIDTITVRCESCGELHIGEKAHHDSFNGRQLYEVICPVDGLSEWWNTDADVSWMVK